MSPRMTSSVIVLSVYNTGMSQRRMCHFGGVLVTGSTGDCHSDNFPCGRWRRLRWDRHAFVSVNNLGAFDEFAHIDNLIIHSHSMIVPLIRLV